MVGGLTENIADRYPKRGGFKINPITMAMAVGIILTLGLWAATFPLGGPGLLVLRPISLLFAALGLLFLLFQFILVSRVKVIEVRIGLDRMLRMHRLSGRLGLTFLFLHAALIVYYRLHFFRALYFDLFVWIGLLVLAAFTLTAALASLHRVLGLKYETWRNVHLANYLLFPPALLHVLYHNEPGSPLSYLWYILAAIYILIVFYRLLAIIRLRSKPYRVVEVRREAPAIWTLFFEGPKPYYKPGQFMFIQLLRGGILSSPHPFTISASPTEKHLAITPKELGDFTSTIKETSPGDLALIDAPYGVFSFLNYDYEELVFIAGGIGITPFMSMLRLMRDRNMDIKVTLFWGNRSEDQLCFKGELEQMTAILPRFLFVPVMSDQPDWTGEKGRISADLIKKHVSSLENAGFFVCGPPLMTRSLIAELKEIEIRSSSIHSELFEL